jgi:diguanylate cyclase (GGDEF)-like protein/PAS domain S-box-containing protein
MFGRLLSTVNALPTLVAYLDRDMRYRFANDVHRTWLGMDPGAMIGRTMADLTPEEHREKIGSELRKALSGEMTEFELELDAFARRVRITYVPDVNVDDGEVVGVIAQMTDLSELTRVESELRKSERMFDGAFRSAVIGKAIVAAEGQCLRINDSFAKMLGYSVNELMGRHFSEFTHPEDVGLSQPWLDEILSGESDNYQIEKRYVRRDGSVIHALLCVSAVRDDRGQPLHFVAEVVDISERKAQQDKLRHQAATDHLTGLLNRRAFDEAVAIAIDRADAAGHGIAVLMVDLDRFKPVNDKFGHATGDALLVEIGRRISKTVRTRDKVARLGGDEFAVLLVDATREQGAIAAKRLYAALRAPFQVDGQVILPSASVGFAYRESRETSAAQLLREADDELYRAKRVGRAG